jgi:excisionase family DNA binding protein
MADGLLSIRRAAEMLSLGHTKTYELLRAGELRSVKIGRARRIPEAEIAAYVARKLAEAQAEAEHDRGR